MDYDDFRVIKSEPDHIIPYQNASVYTRFENVLYGLYLVLNYCKPPDVRQ